MAGRKNRDRDGFPTPGGEETTYRVVADEQPSEALVTAMSEATGESPTKMRPLGDAVDLESIDRVIASAPGRATVSVELRGYHVQVSADRVVVSG